MKTLPNNKTLDIMWSVATSSAIESHKKPHVVFAELLYNHLMNINPPVSLYEDTSCK